MDIAVQLLVQIVIKFILSLAFGAGVLKVYHMASKALSERDGKKSWLAFSLGVFLFSLMLFVF